MGEICLTSLEEATERSTWVDDASKLYPTRGGQYVKKSGDGILEIDREKKN